MHPNMYKNRKVCVSILNTWRGEQWSGCQTIKSVLLTLMSLLDSKPLLNEPGITEKIRIMTHITASFGSKITNFACCTR